MMKVRSLKEQYQIKDEILKERLDKVLQPLMEECGIDVWLIPSKEYNEDPIFEVLTPSGFPTARRISVLVLHNDHQRVNCFNVGMADGELNRFYTQAWNRDKEDQFVALTNLLIKCDPQTIGLNYSANYAYCDGLSVGLFNLLQEKLPKDITDKFISADQLGIRFLETRSELELKYYPEVMAVAKSIIDQAYSSDVIKPGISTCDDVEWFMKEKVNQLGMTFWFPPTIDVQRKSGMYNKDSKIEKGDLVHCDFGINYLGLCTDTQRLAYVLNDGETKLPQALVDGMLENDRFQDIVASNYQKGRSGNDVFKASINQAEKEGIKAMLYTHPLGIHGHAAGPTIGLFSDQNPQPIKGDLLIHPNTAYALELNTKRNIEGYDSEVFFFTEESVVFKDDELTYLAEGRKEITLI